MKDRRGRPGTLTIRTPEGVMFSLTLAGPVTRFLAWLVDLAVIMAAASIVSMALGILKVISLDLSQALIMLSYFIISIGYGIATEWLWRGQTVGKRLLKLRVVDLHGLRLRFSQIVVRNLLRFVDNLPVFYFVGGTVCFLSRNAQRLGDLAANTVVIRTPKVSEPDLERLLAGKYNSLREHPHLAARLRQRVNPKEAAIALDALLRRDQLTPQARVELFEELARHFKALVEFPEEASYGVSDEQYISNVVDIVFRER